MRLDSLRAFFAQKNTKTWLKIIAALLLGAGVLAYMTRQPYGEFVVLLYGIAALFMRVPSRTLFVSALVFLLCVPLATMAIGTQSSLSSSFASYAFTLFVTGVVAVIVELHRTIRFLRK